MTWRFFLGGHDLEMREIRALLNEAGLEQCIVDHELAWGARASAYEGDIRAAIATGETPVLIELTDDLPCDFLKAGLVNIDHHGSRAGADAPSALRQVYDLVGRRHGLAWTRQRALVEANDVGHVPALRAMGATPEEIRAIRDADRRAQGVSAATEQESRRAAAAAQRRGALTLVRTTAPTSSAIADFLLPEYGGPGADDLIVVMPDKIAFFGLGTVIDRLKDTPGSWYGGALPARGYWGAPLTGAAADEIAAAITRYFDAQSVTAK
jgi:hypothetical protein